MSYPQCPECGAVKTRPLNCWTCRQKELHQSLVVGDRAGWDRAIEAVCRWIDEHIDCDATWSWGDAIRAIPYQPPKENRPASGDGPGGCGS